MALNGKNSEKMATSSITANFCISDAQEARTFADQQTTFFCRGLSFEFESAPSLITP